MNQTDNILTAEDMQLLTAARMIVQGFAMLIGNRQPNVGGMQIQPTIPATASATAEKAEAKPKTEAKPKPQPKPEAAEPKQAEEPTQKAEAPADKAIKRADVERAMAAKIKALAAQGNGPGAIGKLFPKFHGAQCVSDLTEADYPAFLEELAKL